MPCCGRTRKADTSFKGCHAGRSSARQLRPSPVAKCQESRTLGHQRVVRRPWQKRRASALRQQQKKMHSRAAHAPAAEGWVKRGQSATSRLCEESFRTGRPPGRQCMWGMVRPQRAVVQHRSATTRPWGEALDLGARHHGAPWESVWSLESCDCGPVRAPDKMAENAGDDAGAE